jgi:hypothetical protein
MSKDIYQKIFNKTDKLCEANNIIYGWQIRAIKSVILWAYRLGRKSMRDDIDRKFNKQSK